MPLRLSNSFFALFDNPSFYNLDLIHRPILRPRLNKPHPLHDPQPTLHSSENRVLPIQPRRRRQRDEELTPVGILPTIRHTQNARPGMLQSRIDLIFELLAVDGSATAAGTGRIAGLQHEIWDYTMEDNVIVVAALSEGGEVGASLETASQYQAARSKELGTPSRPCKAWVPWVHGCCRVRGLWSPEGSE